MQKLLYLLGFVFLFYSCNKNELKEPNNKMDWKKRTVENNILDSLNSGKTYLSVYSQVYSRSNETTHDLTVTISMKNVNESDKVYISKATYYNSKGDIIQSYFDQPIFINPLETIDLVINETNKAGGTGGNFIFEWKIKKSTNAPFFEGVMISTAGQQGLSFTTQGIRIE